MAEKYLVIGAGCFWCVENIFARIKGVTSVISGYAGGDNLNPTYEEVCSGSTNHAEVVKIHYDDELVTLDTLFTVFFNIHDPTSLNKQGEDIGTQYRSTIMYQNEEIQIAAQNFSTNIAEQFDAKIVTTFEPLTKFYPAESYHQDYFTNNPNNGYCQLVVAKKIQKFLAQFSYLLKN